MILILSENFDASTNKVIDWLRFYGANFARLNETDYLDYISISLEENKIKDW